MMNRGGDPNLLDGIPPTTSVLGLVSPHLGKPLLQSARLESTRLDERLDQPTREV
jgi:hypothetical protein